MAPKKNRKNSAASRLSKPPEPPDKSDGDGVVRPQPATGGKTAPDSKNSTTKNQRGLDESGSGPEGSGMGHTTLKSMTSQATRVESPPEKTSTSSVQQNMADNGQKLTGKEATTKAEVTSQVPSSDILTNILNEMGPVQKPADTATEAQPEPEIVTTTKVSPATPMTLRAAAATPTITATSATTRAAAATAKVVAPEEAESSTAPPTNTHQKSRASGFNKPLADLAAAKNLDGSATPLPQSPETGVAAANDEKMDVDGGNNDDVDDDNVDANDVIEMEEESGDQAEVDEYSPEEVATLLKKDDDEEAGTAAAEVTKTAADDQQLRQLTSPPGDNESGDDTGSRTSDGGENDDDEYSDVESEEETEVEQLRRLATSAQGSGWGKLNQAVPPPFKKRGWTTVEADRYRDLRKLWPANEELAKGRQVPRDIHQLGRGVEKADVLPPGSSPRGTRPPPQRKCLSSSSSSNNCI